MGGSLRREKEPIEGTKGGPNESAREMLIERSREGFSECPEGSPTGDKGGAYGEPQGGAH